MATNNWIFAYCETGNPNKIRTAGGHWDDETIEKSRRYANGHAYVSATYASISKEHLIECIKRDGWWFKDGREAKNVGDFPVEGKFL